MNEKRREVDEQRVAELLKENFRGLDPWIPARRPLGSVVPDYEEGSGMESTIKLSFGRSHGAAVPARRTPRAGLALLAAAIVVAVGVASAPLFLRGTGPAASGSPSPLSTSSHVAAVVTPSRAVTPTRTDTAQPVRTGSPWAGLKAKVVLSDTMYNLRPWSRAGTYLAVDEDFEGGCAGDGVCAPNLFGRILDRTGRQIERLQGSDGYAFVSYAGWLDDTTYAAFESNGKAGRYVWGHAGKHDARPIAGIGSAGSDAVAVPGALYIPVGTDAAPKYVRWTPAQGASAPLAGRPVAASQDGSVLALTFGAQTGPLGTTATLIVEDVASGRQLYRDDGARTSSAIISPDARHIAYIRAVDATTSRPVIVETATGVRSDIEFGPLADETALWQVGWAGNDKLFVKSGGYSEGPELTAYLYALNGKQLPTVVDRMAEMAVSSDGTVASFSPYSGPLIIETLPVGNTLFEDASFNIDVGVAAWSPDGKILVLVDGGGRVLFIQR